VGIRGKRTKGMGRDGCERRVGRGGGLGGRGWGWGRDKVVREREGESGKE